MEKFASATDYLRQLMRAKSLPNGMGPQATNGLTRMGHNMLNIAFGMKTLPNGKLDPLAGVKAIGKARIRETDGPLKGMYKYNPKSGDQVYDTVRRPGEYLKQEMMLGPKATRGDLAAQVWAKQKPYEKSEYLRKLKQSGDHRGLQAFQGADELTRAKLLAKAGKGRNTGEYLATASKAEKASLQEVNQMGSLQFMKRHPGLAANWYGRNALHKGFLLGFPGLEVYNTLANNQGNDPDQGTAANLAGTAAATLGWASMTPLGWVGAPLAVDALTSVAKKAGGYFDRKIGTKPLAPQQPQPNDQPQQLAQPQPQAQPGPQLPARPMSYPA